MDGTLLLWLVVGALAAFVVWSLVDGVVVAPRRARAGLSGVARALGAGVTRVDEFLSRASVEAAGRPLEVRAEYVGGQGTHAPRGDRGHLFVVATRLAPPAWEMHDVQVRQRRRTDAFEDRFTLVESGLPVREGWLGAEVRGTVGRFFDHPLAAGTLRVDRGELKHLVPWTRVHRPVETAVLRDFLDRFAAVAGALERAASRPHPMG